MSAPPDPFPSYLRQAANLVAWYINNYDPSPEELMQHLRQRLPNLSEQNYRDAIFYGQLALENARAAEQLPGDAELSEALAGIPPPFATVRVNALVPIASSGNRQQYKQVSVDVPWSTTLAEIREFLAFAVENEIASYEQTVGDAVISGPLLFKG